MADGEDASSAVGLGVAVILGLAAFTIAPVLAGLALFGVVLWYAKPLAFLAGRSTASLRSAYRTGQATKELEDVARVLGAEDPEKKP